MTRTDDERWLDALAGKPAGDPLDPLNVEAASVRQALLARQKQVQNTLAQPSTADLESILFRLRRERLLGKGGTVGQREKVAWFAMAVSVMFAVVLAVRDESREVSSVAQGPVSAPQPATAVNAPLTPADDDWLKQGMAIAGLTPRIEQKPDGSQVLRFPATPEVLAHLRERKWEATLRDDEFIVVLPPPKKP